MFIALIEGSIHRKSRCGGGEPIRPIKALGICSGYFEPFLVSGGQENAVAAAIFGGEKHSGHTVQGRPSHVRVKNEVIPFRFSRHTPVWSPVGRGSVVLGQQGSQPVCEAIVAVICIVTIFSQGIIGAFAVFVRGPIVYVLRFSLAPGKVVAIRLWGYVSAVNIWARAASSFSGTRART